MSSSSTSKVPPHPRSLAFLSPLRPPCAAPSPPAVCVLCVRLSCLSCLSRLAEPWPARDRRRSPPGAGGPAGAAPTRRARPGAGANPGSLPAWPFPKQGSVGRARSQDPLPILLFSWFFFFKFLFIIFQNGLLLVEFLFSSPFKPDNASPCRVSVLVGMMKVFP